MDFSSGCVAGTVATAVSFPFDVLRTRMIGQGEPKVGRYKPIDTHSLFDIHTHL